jgi:hypothetical protein
MKRMVKVFFLAGICAVIVLAGFTIVQVTAPSYHGTSSLLSQCGINTHQQEANAHMPVTEACNLPNTKADAAFDKCEKNCRADCNGWCPSVAGHSGCVIGCAVMRDYAKGTASYQ